MGARLYSRGLVQVQHRSSKHEHRREDEQREQTGHAYRLIAGLTQREEEDEPREEDRDRECRERPEGVDVVGARELHAAPECVDDPATLHQRGRHGKAHKRQPGQHEQIDAGKDPQPRDADRKKGHKTDGERDRDMAAALDRTDEGDRARVRRAQQERPDTQDDSEPSGIVELCRGSADQRRPEAERQRGPEADPVETKRFRHELPDRTRLGWEWRRELCARH